MSDTPRYFDIAVALPMRKSFSYRLPEGMPAPQSGARVRVPFGRSSEMGFVLRELRPGDLDKGMREHPERIKEIGELLDDPSWLDDSLLSLARWISAYYGASLGEVLRSTLPIKPMKRPRNPEPEPLPPKPPALKLNADQARAMSQIVDSMDKGFEAFLLHGVTGSGKTEVYLRAIEKVLAAQKQVIVLVPEISLTPQMSRRFRARLGDQVGIFHSGLSAGERFNVWKGIREGNIRVVLGPRSAIFAPFSRLGLIILDEEHDGSYKQTEKPRYHARSVALVRARSSGAMVILGSGTPSLDSLHNAGRGKYRLLELPKRVGGGRRPPIEIADMTEAGGELLSEALLSALDETLARGEKAMLLLNRRGHSRFRICRACGHVPLCSRCDISLTYHSGRGRMICHYCGLERPLQASCPECGGGRWELVGAGTQQVELALQMRFPGTPVLRMDHDSTGRKGSHADILSRFSEEGPSLLLGTQMIAKGHHIPAVTLVGVISADTGLFLPDFRAAERSWQLLEQVAGRSGRGERPGRVIVQTLNPDHPVLASLATDRGAEFLDRELRERRLLGYPPFRKLNSLRVSAPDENLAERAAEKLIRRFRETWPEHPGDILGPVEAAIPRLKDRYRRQILFKGRLSHDQKAWFHEAFAALARDLKRSGALSLDLDVDPESIL
jgi:primosomal protein N' (replication factor Y) (superfamily II helicase)